MLWIWLGLRCVDAVTCPLSSYTLADGVDFLTHHADPVAELHLPNCSWYKARTCCTSDDALRISHARSEVQLNGATVGCREQINLLMCSVCSPAQSSFFVEETVVGFKVPVLHVCKTFCDRLHRECASATLETGLDRIDIDFENGSAFCRAVGLHVTETDDTTVCFSSARRRSHQVVVYAAVLVGITAAAILSQR